MLWEHELIGISQVFPQLFQVFPNFHKCFYNLIATHVQKKCFLLLLENATRTLKLNTTNTLVSLNNSEVILV